MEMWPERQSPLISRVVGTGLVGVFWFLHGAAPCGKGKGVKDVQSTFPNCQTYGELSFSLPKTSSVQILAQ